MRQARWLPLAGQHPPTGNGPAHRVGHARVRGHVLTLDLDGMLDELNACERPQAGSIRENELELIP